VGVDGRGCYKLVSELSEGKVVWVALPDRGWWLGMLQNGIRAMVLTLSLDGPC
jgi:hypothetical protein